MKSFFTVMTGVLFLCMVLMPMTAIKSNEPETQKSTVSEEKQTESTKESTKGFRVKFIETGKIKTVDKTEYLTGVLAGEMPASYQTEALKAQAVAAFTYAYSKKQKSTEKYDVTNSETTDQKYLTYKERKEKWGKNFNKYENKLKQAVKSVDGQVLMYNGKPITAVYHAISCGKTENAKNVWGKGYPYLQSVESVGDLLSEDYLSTAEFSESEFAEILKKLNVNVSKEAKNWVTEINKTSCGTVKTVTIGNKKIEGTKIREAFSLRSACFDLEYKNKVFKFTVKGYGHMLGLSQYGSNYMAKQGSNYKEILLWYYSNCNLGKVKL